MLIKWKFFFKRFQFMPNGHFHLFEKFHSSLKFFFFPTEQNLMEKYFCCCWTQLVVGLLIQMLIPCLFLIFSKLILNFEAICLFFISSLLSYFFSPDSIFTCTIQVKIFKIRSSSLIVCWWLSLVVQEIIS